MTFRVGVRVREGLVWLADTQIVKGGEVSSKAKLSLREHGGSPFFVMTSGLRSVRDKVVLRLEDALDGLDSRLGRLHQVATAFGDELRNVRAEDGPSLEAGGLRFNLHAIIGGCRAFGIPARYVSGYAVDLEPPDFHGFFEAFLDGEWYLFDATRMAPIDGLVRIATGRDAADVAFAAIVGAAELVGKDIVVIDLDRTGPHDPSTTPALGTA